MRLIFLGTGGGRFVTLFQTRSTGGTLLDLGDYYISIDPGPGALTTMKNLHLDPRKIFGVMVSHSHPDHYSNAEIIIEGITHGGRKKRGFLIGSKSVIDGYDDIGPAISKYHKGLLDMVYVGVEGNIIYPTPELEIGFVQMKHTDPTTLGFRITTPDGTIGYLADTAYVPGMGKKFSGSDILILPVTRPTGADLPHHLSTTSAAEVIKEAKPKLALMNHLGLKMIKANPQKEARWIYSVTGIKTLAAWDGLIVELKEGKYEIRK